MYIECIDPEGYVSKTPDFSRSRATWAIGHYLNYYCDGQLDSLSIYDAGLFSSSPNGRSWYLNFEGLYGDPGQYSFKSSEENPLTGTDITFNSTTV